jgi:hypothetical protein
MKEYSAYKIYPWVHALVNVLKAYQELKRRSEPGKLAGGADKLRSTDPSSALVAVGPTSKKAARHTR